jgi:hypothetical protein
MKKSDLKIKIWMFKTSSSTKKLGGRPGFRKLLSFFLLSTTLNHWSASVLGIIDQTVRNWPVLFFFFWNRWFTWIPSEKCWGKKVFDEQIQFHKTKTRLESHSIDLNNCRTVTVTVDWETARVSEVRTKCMVFIKETMFSWKLWKNWFSYFRVFASR